MTVLYSILGENQTIRIEKIEQDIVDGKGWTIPRGAKIHVVKEFDVKNPITQRNEHFKVVRIDNGTDDINLFPETFIKEAD